MRQMRVEDSLAAARSAKSRGEFGEAERIYRGILAADAGNGEAMHGLAVVLAQAGKWAEAETWWDAAVGREPGRAEWVYHRGLVKLHLGKLAEAREAFGRMVEIEPGFPDGYNCLGVVLKRTGEVATAVQCYRKALELNPTFPEAANNLGVALKELGRNDEAVEAFRRALEARTDYAEAMCNLGDALRLVGRVKEAVAVLRRAAELKPDVAEIWYNLGAALQHDGQKQNAAGAYRKALDLRPAFWEALNNLGNVLHATGDFEGATRAYERALAIRGDAAVLHNNLGRALKEVGRLDEAVAEYRRAVALRGDFTDALTNLGNALVQNGEIDAAIEAYERAVATPGGLGSGDRWSASEQEFNARWNYAMALLLRGEFERGWRMYEVRNRRNGPGLRAEFGERMWSGEELRGTTILLLEEQGLGDTIHFVRYAPMLAARDANVVLRCPAALKTLMEGQTGFDEVVVPGEAIPTFDFYCPLMSLPYHFKTKAESIPANVPYLTSDPDRVRQWARELEGCDGRLRVGLVWAGNPKYVNDRDRSMPFSAIETLADVKGVAWFSLQKGARAADVRNVPSRIAISDLSDRLKDFAETAAVIANLDLVISVDTAVAHLAGALGKPVWTLLPRVPDWRWQLERDDSPWYPTMRLFRQKAWGDWEGLMAEVAKNLGDVTR